MENSYLTDKESILSNIRLTKERIKKLKNNYDDYYLIHKKPLNFNWLQHIIVWLIMLFVVSYAIDFITLPLAYIFGRGELSDFAFWVIVCLYTVTYINTYVRINRKKMKKKLTQYADRILEIPIENKKLLFEIENESVVPEDYRNIYTLDKLERYFINGRADDLKEALNLFEEEKRYDEQMNEIKVMQELQIATYRKADEASTLGWINLLTKR
ncbi:hypothetical protein FGG79_18960 [Bacillus sp. BHET2]|uniref:hypothetical protein n=1 Tax=Bacillus sp. BHET2 TaxID=2583818 RepID=UPI00110F67CA|nr:hypothetical protein [Bacillus sp. BHET2]TMU83777.1 hypothetical protein FGG79_18960 [Bacillus sp. BHET2]